jgi:hypothetical protein
LHWFAVQIDVIELARGGTASRRQGVDFSLVARLGLNPLDRGHRRRFLLACYC